MSDEPLIHSHLDDELPMGHPWAYESVYCDKCKVMVHANNNECMQTWIEWPKTTLRDAVAVCAQCVGKLKDVLIPW